MKTTAFFNLKGGVSKTSSCISLGAGLALQGKRVLLIDCDAQGSLTDYLAVRPSNDEPSLFDVLVGKADMGDVIRHCGTYDVIPANLELSRIDMIFSDFNKGKDFYDRREFLLKKALEDMSEHYDFILVDCSPSLNLVSVMALTASNSIIIPTLPHYLGLAGISQLETIIMEIKTSLNPTLEISGILVSQFHARQLMDRDALEKLIKAFGKKVFLPPVSFSVRMEECPSKHQDIFTYRGKSKPADQYRQIVSEFLRREA